MNPCGSELSGDDLDFVSQLLRRETAIELGSSKGYLIETRIKAIARKAGFEDSLAFVRALRSAPTASLRQSLVDALTTNETYFFRDESLWKYMRSSLLPELVSRRAGRRALSIWCGACATGQEPYSLAMMIQEEFPALAEWRVRILATDVSEGALSRAREGLYDSFEVNRGLPARLLMKHFERKGTRFQAREPLRRMVEFKSLNLVEDLSEVGRVDLVLLRNVLIYFGPAARRSVLTRVAAQLEPDGFLLMAGSEVSHPVAGLFEVHDRSSGAHVPASRGAAPRAPLPGAVACPPKSPATRAGERYRSNEDPHRR